MARVTTKRWVVVVLAMVMVIAMAPTKAMADAMDDAELAAEEDEMEGAGAEMDGYDGYDGYGGGDDDYPSGGGGADFGGEIKGFVDLDEYTFDKVVDGSKAAFAVFYEPYASDLEDVVTEVEALAEEFGEHSSLHLVKVNVENNPSFVERFGITADAMPKAPKEADANEPEEDDDDEEVDEDLPPTKKAFLYFPAGDDKPSKVTVELTKAALAEFLTKQVGEPGTVAPLVPVFTDYMKKLSSAKDAAKLTEQAQGIVKGLKGADKSFGEYYLKVMSNLVKKGKDYVQNEHGRLTRMIDAGGLKEDKVSEFNRRKRVLKALANVQGKPIPADHAEL